MIQIVINSRDGAAFVSPQTIYLQTNTVVNSNGMYVSLKQSLNKDSFTGSNIDYCGIGKSVYIDPNPAIPATKENLIAKGEADVLAFIISLKLPQIVSATSV
jgi:hypothetical protein